MKLVWAILWSLETGHLGTTSGTGLDVGLQLEIPTVSDPALGDGHFLLLPTLQAGWHPSRWIVMAVVGWGQTLDDDHHHHSAASIVNPHQNQELLVRLDLGGRMSANDWRGTIRFDGIQAFGSHGPEATILTLGPTMDGVERLGQSRRLADAHYGFAALQFRSGVRELASSLTLGFNLARIDPPRDSGWLALGTTRFRQVMQGRQH